MAAERVLATDPSPRCTVEPPAAPSGPMTIVFVCHDVSSFTDGMLAPLLPSPLDGMGTRDTPIASWLALRIGALSAKAGMATSSGIDAVRE